MGALSWILTILALNGAVMTMLLLTAPGNRKVNVYLAALVGLISIRLIIYVLGFSGMFDINPWITFVPLDASLAFGPLLWLFVFTLTFGQPPPLWRWHLLPAAVQLTYFVIAFALPLEVKLLWYRGPHLDVIEPLGLAAVLISCVAYLFLAWRRQSEYQSWLDDRFSNRDRWRLVWISKILFAFAAMILAATVAATIDAAFKPLNYFDRMPVIIASSVLAYTLGLLGWRYATLDLPLQISEADQVDIPDPVPSRPAAAFSGYSKRVETEGWWSEEGLTLSDVAKRLGTSERTLSRSLKEGGGRNFNDFINAFRVEAVMRALTAGSRSDLLALALDCGFSSKASFNRAFLRHAGMTPTQWRISKAQISPISGAGVN